MKELPRLSVAEFNTLLNKYLQTAGDFIIEGEITQLNQSSRGGVNIVIKDTKEQSLMNVSGYAPRIQGIKLVDEGMKVAIWGTPQIWSPTGRLSVSIYKIVPIGKGALKQAYQQLKSKLEAEGLFSVDRKRDLPNVIQNIALITAKGSAAASDFLKILKENNARLNVDFYHTQVQGKYAEQGIITCIQRTQNKGYDCIVLIRGGGSLEDLIAFNEEQVARAIFASTTPIIAGVGHERDESIADFTADIRASTPSQAAYYIISINQNFLRSVDMRLERISSQLSRKINTKYSQMQQRLNFIESKLNRKIHDSKLKLNHYASKIQKFPQALETIKAKVSLLSRLLESHNPENIMKKGYSIIKDKSGTIITSVDQLKDQQKIQVHLTDGSKNAIISETRQIGMFDS